MTVTEDLLSAFSWRSIGPPRGGRVSAVAGDPVDRAVFWFGACGGGVWKTTDGGSYWRNVSDAFFGSAAVGAIAVAPSDPNVVYAGMGESCVRNNVAHGDGVYRTIDGGRTWEHLGLEATRHISRVRIHPTNPDLVYVAALGDIFGSNPERGVYRSRDGGRTWDHVLDRGADAGAADLWLDPSNPRILYAAIWQARRYPWTLSSGGPGSGLFRSTDGGGTWTELTRNEGLPKKALLGRMGVCGAPSQAGRVWALVEAGEDEGGLYRSDDAGDMWERVSENKAIQGRPWYYSHIVPDPHDAETVYALNFQFWRSTDGGRHFDQIATPHGDNHDLWIDPADSRRIIEGNDGGACVSYNGGDTFSTIYNQPTSQIYHVVADNEFPYRVYGTQQDNSAICVPSRSRRGAIYWNDCENVGFAESGYIAVDPTNSDVVYSGAVGSAGGGGGPLLRHDRSTGQTQLITVWPEYNWGEDPAEWAHRFQWTYPIVFSPHDPSVLYVTGERVFRSTDRGASWDAISPDLTRADPEKMLASGGPITKDTSGAEVYCTIFSFAESPIEPGVLWVGTDDGMVHISRAGGEKWEDVTPADLPEWSLITTVEPSPHDAATAYLCATRYRLGDRTPFIFRTNDYGTTWRLITEGIPAGEFTRVVRADPVRAGLLYAGTETRPWISIDDGRSWVALSGGIPAVPIYDLIVKNNDLVVATNGRGFWILDDVTPLRELPADLASAPAVLFTPPTTYRYPTPQGFRRGARGTNYLGGAAFVVKTKPGGVKENVFLDAGNNPADGVTVWYHLRDTAAVDEIELSFLDRQGNVLHSFTPDAKKKEDGEEDEPPAPPTATAPEGAEGEGQEMAIDPVAADEEAEADKDDDKKNWWEALPRTRGLNRFTWDLRGPGAYPVPDGKKEPKPGTGYVVPPGTYSVRLRLGEETYEKSYEVKTDPRSPATGADLDARHDMLESVNQKITAVHGALGRVKRMKEQAEAWSKRKEAPDELKDAAKELARALGKIEAKLTQPKYKHDTDRLKMPAGLDVKLAAVPQVLASADAAPTRQIGEVFEKLSGQADDALSELESLASGGVAELNAQIASSGLGAIDVAPLA